MMSHWFRVITLQRKEIAFLISTYLISANAGVRAQTAIPCDLKTLSEITLDTNPTILRNALQIRDAAADVQAALSTFDVHLSSGINTNRTNTNLVDADPRNQFLQSNLISKYGDFFVSSQKRFRTGTIANIRTNYVGASSNYPINAYNQQVGPYVADHESSVNLSLTQPLLRGAGNKANNALINAARLVVESTESSYLLNTSYELLQMSHAYWEYLTAYKALEIFHQNEDRIRDVLYMTTELVKSDKKPESDLLQIKADLATQERQTKMAEQSLYNARLNLGRAIGIDEESSKSLGMPLDDFPQDTVLLSNDKVNLTTFSTLALQNRLDIKALEKNQKAIDQQLIYAKNELLPAVDLSGFATYGGRAFGGGIDQYFNAFGNSQGRNSIVGLSLTFTFPVNNNLARSNYAKNRLSQQDQTLAYQDLKRNIDLNVSIAYNNLLNSMAILEKTRETLAYSEQVFDNEQTKFQNGLTTLLNLILFQERLTSAQLEHIQAKQQLASAIVSLRYETGTLLAVNIDGSGRIEKEQFYSIPNTH